MANLIFTYIIMLLTARYVNATRSLVNEGQVTTLQALMDFECPGLPSIVCEGNSSQAGGVRTPSSGQAESCCTGCSCLDTCGLTGKCCYPEDDAYRLREQGTMQCLYPNTKVYHSRHAAMYMFIVGSPANGCIVEGRCAGNQSLVPWKTFLPVFSKEKRMNYVTKECANCYGVTDAVPWKSTVVLNYIASVNLVDIIDIVFEGPSDDVYASFSHPGSNDEAKYTMCNSNVIYDCTKSSNRTLPDILTGKHISFETIKNGCNSGPRSPFINRGTEYKNIYCAYCHQRNVVDECRQHAMKGDKDVPIIATLDYEFLENLPRSWETKNKLGTPMACKADDPTSCRSILCPAMKSRNSNGVCVFSSNNWYPKGMVIVLNLTTLHGEPADNHFSNISEFDLLKAFAAETPWFSCWNIHRVGWRSYPRDENYAIEVVMLMVCEVDRVDPNILMNSIEKSLAKSWKLRTNIGVLSLSQTFSRHGFELATIDGSEVFAPSYMRHLTQETHRPQLSTGGLLLASFSHPTWKVGVALRFILSSKVSMSLYKLFLCHQVELNQSEYVLHFEYERVLLLKSSRKILFEYEIAVTNNPHSHRKTVKICLEDSGMLANVATINQGKLVKTWAFLMILLVFYGWKGFFTSD